MKIINKIKRFFFKFKNNDPLYKCKLYKEKGCAYVDGLFCGHPNCSKANEYMGNGWVSCVNCKFQNDCCSKQFGLGCYDGKEIEYDTI